MMKSIYKEAVYNFTPDGGNEGFCWLLDILFGVDDRYSLNI